MQISKNKTINLLCLDLKKIPDEQINALKTILEYFKDSTIEINIPPPFQNIDEVLEKYTNNIHSISMIDVLDFCFTGNRPNLHYLEQIIPPLGLIQLATYAQQRLKEKVEFKIVSQVVDCKNQKELINHLKFEFSS